MEMVVEDAEGCPCVISILSYLINLYLTEFIAALEVFCPNLLGSQNENGANVLLLTAEGSIIAKIGTVSHEFLK